MDYIKTAERDADETTQFNFSKQKLVSIRESEPLSGIIQRTWWVTLIARAEGYIKHVDLVLL